MRIVGHGAVREALRSRESGSGHSRSYIFSGPESVGKFPVALEWAKSLSHGRDDESEAGPNPDIVVVAPRIETEKGVIRERAISVREIRDAIREAGFLPFGSGRRVIIVRDAHRMTEEAQNALLKTLEEPPERVTIILTTHEVGRMVPTVLSRCQIVGFRSVPLVDMRLSFASRGIPDALLSLGRPGLAIRYLEDPEGLKDDLSWLERLKAIGTASGADRLSLAEELSKDGVRLGRLLDWWIGSLVVPVGTDGASHMAEVLAAGKVFETSSILRERPGSVRLSLENLLLSVGSSRESD